MNESDPSTPEKNIERQNAVQELEGLVKPYIEQIKQFQSSGQVNLKLSVLFNQGNESSIDQISTIAKEIIEKVEEIASGYEGIAEVKLILKSLYSVNLNSVNIEQGVRILDSSLVDIANSSSIPVRTKTKVFDIINGMIDKKLLAYLESQFKERGSLSTNEPLPITTYYVTNVSETIKKMKGLRDLKSTIREQIHLLYREMRKDPSDSILARYGDYMVDAEIEEYEAELQYSERAPEDFLLSNIPKTNSERSINELRSILNDKNAIVTENTLRLAKIQLLRIYREYINTQINSLKTAEIILNEQLPKSDGLRIGGSDDEKKEQTRKKRIRRLALFENLHTGIVSSEEITYKLDPKNYLPVSQQLIDFWIKNGESTSTENSLMEKLSAEQKYKLAQLMSIKDLKIPQKIDPGSEQEVNVERIPEEIIRESLIRLGLGSNDEEIQTQIDLYEKKGTQTEIKTYGVLAKASANIAINHKYRLFILPQSYKNSLASLLGTISHELAHIVQQISRDNSNLPGLNQMTSLGRSDILAESGAIKVEVLMKDLFGISREVNTYHFDIFRMIIEGKNYWEIFNEIYKIITETSIKNKENLSREEIIKQTIRRIDRVYGNLGATGNPTSEGRYPTSVGGLRYTYQGMDEFSQQPYYVSGIPSHRNELKDLLPEPNIGNKPLTPEMIIGAIIEAAYETLLDNKIIQSTSL